MQVEQHSWAEANRRAADEIGGHAAVAELLGFKDRRNVWPWTTGQRQFPAEHCAKVERGARTVTRRDLRPDDWMLIWPELVGLDAQTAGQEG